MIIIPAIDLKDGACVRLEQGRMDKATIFSKEPGKTASQWAQKGARRLHVVDLNGAMVGKPRNEAAIKQIIAAVDSDIPVQLGGGIRDLDTIERYLDDGVSYIVIGTAAVKNPGSCTRHATPSRVTSSSAWTRRTARSPPTAGRNSPAMTWWTSRSDSRTTAWKR
jgi:phosphoribosylformimino-5-aminoimidazole carboxamide ribonucleotide (ProFAR) isomerase